MTVIRRKTAIRPSRRERRERDASDARGGLDNKLDFSKLPTQTGIPCGNEGFLTLRVVLCGGACAAIMRSSKALAEIQHDTYQNRLGRVFKGACQLMFRNEMVLSDRSDQIRTRELEEEALRKEWTIENNRGGRRTAVFRVDHMTGAAKIRKQTE